MDNTLLGWRFGVLVPVLISLMFIQLSMPIGVLLFGVSIVLLFFLGLNYFSKEWVSIPYDRLEWRIFFICLIVRVVFIFYLYLLTYWFDNDSFPFEIYAADSWVYHNVATDLMDAPFGDWLRILDEKMKSRSDFGYPFYQGIIYSIFGSHTFPVRIINAILGSLTVLMLSRIVKTSWGESHAKMTAIVGMLFPTLIWYCGIQLKETLMVFIVVVCFYLTWMARSKNKMTISLILMSFIFCFLLFFFRTFLGALVSISMLLLFVPHKTNRIGTGILISIVLVLYLFYSLALSSNIFQDVNNQIEDSRDFFSRNLENEKNLLGNVSFDQVALAPLIIGGAAITPFPSYLDTEARQLSIFTRFQNDLIRNMMYFFMYIGLYHTIKNKFREFIGILFFFGAYLSVITSAANSFQARFHMPIIPFAILFIGIGIVEFSNKSRRYWLIYLLFIFVAQLMWTYFKLNIRGISA